MTGPAQPHRTAQLRTATRSLARLRSALLRSATRSLARLRSMLLRSVGDWRLGVVMKRSGCQVRMDSSFDLVVHCQCSGGRCSSVWAEVSSQLVVAQLEGEATAAQAGIM